MSSSSRLGGGLLSVVSSRTKMTSPGRLPRSSPRSMFQSFGSLSRTPGPKWQQSESVASCRTENRRHIRSFREVSRPWAQGAGRVLGNSCLAQSAGVTQQYPKPSRSNSARSRNPRTGCCPEGDLRRLTLQSRESEAPAHIRRLPCTTCSGSI